MITVAEDAETDVNFVIRRMEVVLDNILNSTALRSGQPTLQLPFTILKPMPAALVPTLMTKRKIKLRTFQAWRKIVKEKKKPTGRVHMDSGLFNQLQLTGRVLMSKDALSVSLMSTFLVVAMDNQVVDACVAYCQEIIKCKAQLDQDIQEIKKQTAIPTLPPAMSGSRRLERRDTEVERQRFVLSGDFGCGCVRLCCSVEGCNLATISATNAHGEFEHQGGRLNSQTFSAKFEDLIVGLS